MAWASLHGGHGWTPIHKIATKRFRVGRGGRVSKINFGKETFFAVRTVTAPTWPALRRLLEELQDQPRACVVRGRLLPHADPSCTRRLLHDAPDGPRSFESEPRRWLGIDLDGVPNEWRLDPRIPEESDEAFECLAGRFPGEFQDATYWAQWSSSQCVPERVAWPGEPPPDRYAPPATLSAHFWYRLDRPIPDEELNRWAKWLKKTTGLEIDPKLFHPVQPHFTASPLFDEGLRNPLRRRSAFREGLVDEVALVLPEPEPRRSSNGHATDAKGFFEGGAGFEHYLGRIGDDGDGFQAPIMRAVASFFATHGPDANAEPLKALLIAAIAAADPGTRSPADVARYLSDRFLDDKIRWARDREALKPRPELGPPLAATTLPPYHGPEETDRAAALAAQRAAIEAALTKGVREAGARREVARLRAERIKAAGGDAALTPAEKAAITRAVKREVLPRHGLARLPSAADLDLFTGAQGSGKSSTVAETIARLRLADPLVLWWVVPTLQKAEEQAETYRDMLSPGSLPVTVVRGRAAKDPVRDGEAMCPRFEVVNRAAGMGVTVEKEICPSCPLNAACGYQRQRAELEAAAGSRLYVVAREYLWLPCPAPKADLVLVDEDVTGRAAATVEFCPARLLDDDKWPARGRGGLTEALARRLTAVRVQRALVEHQPRALDFLRENGVTAQALRACVEQLADLEEAKPEVSGAMRDPEIARALDAVEAREVLKVHALFRQVWREFARPRRRLNSVWYDPQALRTIEGKRERVQRLFAGYIRHKRFARTVPVIVLDGTGSLTLNRKVFGDRMREHRFAVPRDAEVIQVTGKSFSRQSLTGRDRHGNPVRPDSVGEAAALRARVRNVLALLPGPVLLVTYKAVEEVLNDERLPPDVLTTHFGGLRGLNAFEHCATVVVLGREQPSAQAIEALARPFVADDDEPFLPVGEYVAQTRRRRMRDGSVSVAEIEAYPDPRAQELLEQTREAEVPQGADRSRAIFNRRNFLLLTPVVVDITVDRILTWQEAQPSRFALAFARHGAMPLSRRELARCFPDLWGSERAVRDDLDGSGNNGRIPQIEFLFGKPAHYRFSRASYRREGQRGKASPAVMRADLPNPKAALEAVVGPVAHFELVEPEGDEAANARERPPACESAAPPDHHARVEPIRP